MNLCPVSKIILSASLFFISTYSYGYTISGQILDLEAGAPPSEAIEVEVRLPGDFNGDPVARTLSDIEGNFKLDIDEKIPEYFLSVESDNYLFNSKRFLFDPTKIATEETMFVTSVTEEIDVSETFKLNEFTLHAPNSEKVLLNVRVCDNPLIQPVTGISGFGRGIHVGKRKDKIPNVDVSIALPETLSGKINVIKKGSKGKQQELQRVSKSSEALVSQEEPFTMLATSCVTFAPLNTRTVMLGTFWNKPTGSGDCTNCGVTQILVPVYSHDAAGGCGPWTYSLKTTTSWSVSASLSASILKVFEAEIGGSFEKATEVENTVSNTDSCGYAGVASSTVWQLTCYKITDCEEDPVYVILRKAVKTPQKIPYVKGCNNNFPCTKVEKRDRNSVQVPCEEPKVCKKQGDDSVVVPCTTCPNYLDYSALAAAGYVANPGVTIDQLYPPCGN